MKAEITIMLKNGVLDPQAKAVQNALGHLGFDNVAGVRQGKFIELDLAEKDEEKAAETIKAMCEKLLANMVIENYSYKIVATA